MPIVANNTTILFNDSSVQTTAGASGVNTVTAANSPGTWTKPASVKCIKVTVVGGGGNGGPAYTIPISESTLSGYGGGGGGGAIKYYPAASLPGPQPYTSGAAGATSSFGAAPVGPISATGGAPNGGAAGVGSGGTVNTTGSRSPTVFSLASGYTYGTSGGDSIFNGGANLNSAAPSTSYGAGGGGSSSPTVYAGAPGAVIIEEFN